MPKNRLKSLIATIEGYITLNTTLPHFGKVQSTSKFFKIVMLVFTCSRYRHEKTLDGRS